MHPLATLPGLLRMGSKTHPVGLRNTIWVGLRSRNTESLSSMKRVETSLFALALAFGAFHPSFAAGRSHEGSLRRFDLVRRQAGIEAASYPGEEGISETFLRKTLSFLAADDKKGRKPGSTELEVTIFDYMIQRFQEFGLTPAGNSEGTSYKQPFKASSWWPIDGRDPNGFMEAHDDHTELFCSTENEHGFAMDPQGNPVTVDKEELGFMMGRGFTSDDQVTVVAGSYDTHNLAAMLEGSDPVLKNEVIVLGAHIDHVGTRGSSIYNGADDNGSGSSILLNLAKAFSELKAKGQGPKRSILFLWFSAEEMGLLGSQYWAKMPTIDFSRIKAMLNMDMLGRTEVNEISVFCGHSIQKGETFHGWHDTDDLGFTDVQHNLQNFLRRSDQYPFYRKGVPVMFFFEGFRGQQGQAMNVDYHRPGDVVEKINFTKLSNSARFIYRHAFKSANEGVHGQ